jgi:hypothetical protein
MSIIQNVEQFFENLWNNTLKPDAQEAISVAEAFFSAAVTATAQQLGSTGLKIVTDAVAAAETTGGTGVQKLAAAQASIAANLSSAGVTAATNVINAAIEGAVAQMNTPQTQSTAQPSGTDPSSATGASGGSSGTSTGSAS